MVRDEGATSSEPLDLYAEFLAKEEAGTAQDFEDLCRAHPEAAEELRELRQACDHVASVFGGRSSEAAAAPAQEDAATDPGPVEELLERIEARRPDTSRYQRLEELGRGGMGVVVRVFDRDLRRQLAMKVLGPAAKRASGTPDRQRLARFLGEAQLAAQLQHPGIVAIHDVGVDEDGRLYFTMPVVEGSTLNQVFEWARREESGWNRTRLLGVFVAIAEAVAYAHARGVVHPDLKPSNVMVGRFGETSVMDWGLARLMEAPGPGGTSTGPESGASPRQDTIEGEPPDGPASVPIDTGESASSGTDRGRPTAASKITTERDESARSPSSTDSSPYSTREGAVLGTPLYMAPEQAAGHSGRVGVRCDVYSVGAMLYEALAGVPPYVAESSDHRRVVAAVRRGPPRPLEAARPGLPPELVAICDKAMARDPEGRYGDLQSLAEDLRAFLDQRVVRAYRTGAWVELRKWVSRNRGVATTVAAAAVVLVAALLLVLGLNDRLRLTQSELLGTNAELSESETALQRRLAEVTQLSDQALLDELRAEESELWPARPWKQRAMKGWIDRAQALLGRTDQNRASLARLESEVQARAREPAATGAGPATGSPGEGAQAPAASADSWAVATTAEQWWRANLVHLIEDLEDFQRPNLGLLEQVQQRLLVATTIEEQTVERHADAWNEAILAIEESERYGGLVLEEQIGLVPLGPDPDSELWEFWHVESGTRPPRDPETGHIRLEQSSGIVLVLIPGGLPWIGAQADDPEAQHHDPLARSHEGPPRQLSLAPYFLSKFEVTQQQSLTLCGENPSDYAMGEEGYEAPITGLHPCTNATWFETMEVLRRVELCLPTEAQWEHAARAGTDTPWWCGEDPDSIVRLRAGNVADLRFARHHSHNLVVERFDDGHSIHAPVGSLAPNGFGLHDVLGNVAEWCLDWYADLDASHPWDPETGERLVTGASLETTNKTFRGGSFADTANAARSAHRYQLPPDERGIGLGTRAARGLAPPRPSSR